MKITINIDCTPQEARVFFGLPNVEPMQDALVERMHERLQQYLDQMEPDSLIKTWFTGGLRDFSALQERFWHQFMETMTRTGGTGPKAGE